MKRIMMTLCMLLAVNAGSTMYAVGFDGKVPEKSKENKGKTVKPGEAEKGAPDAPKEVKAKAGEKTEAPKPAEAPSHATQGYDSQYDYNANKNTVSKDGGFDFNSNEEGQQKNTEKSYTTQLDLKTADLDYNNKPQNVEFVDSVADALNLDPKDGDSVKEFDLGNGSGDKMYLLTRKDGTAYKVEVDQFGRVTKTLKKEQQINPSWGNYEEFNPAEYDRDGNVSEETIQAKKDNETELINNAKLNILNRNEGIYF